ncbi:hypothetical protein K1719_035583 [Acacia pycnantha]|nr:hypothetical protein K1719_035583 [Acacia pycnantha]
MELSGKQKLQVPSSTEEDDLLARSSKKVTQREEETGRGGSWPKLGEKPCSYNVGGPSFADKLKGTYQEANEKEDVGEKERDDLSDDSFSEGQTPRKTKEKVAENQVNPKVGSRFEVLAEVDVINGDNHGVHNVIIPIKATSVWKPTGQEIQPKNSLGREKISGKTSNGNHNREEAVAKIVEGAVTTFVQQGDRRVEKRAREGYEDKRGEILMITTGDEDVDIDCAMEIGQGKSGQHHFDNIGTGIGEGCPDMGPFQREEDWKDPLGDIDLSMVSETPLGSCGKGLYNNIKTIKEGSRPILLILADTRCADASRLRHLFRIGFNEMKLVPSVGLSGGLAAFWDSSAIPISVVEEDRQFLHFRCSIPGNPEFLLTSIYALPHSNFQSTLWDNLKTLSREISLPWAVFGDFNDIMSLYERVGGRRGNSERNLVVEFYKKLFHVDHDGMQHVDPALNTISKFPIIDSHVLDKLATTPSGLEVHEILISMGSYKAPGAVYPSAVKDNSKPSSSCNKRI